MFKKKKDMKKKYFAPNMEVVKIQTQQMLAASPGYGGTTDATSGNLAPEFEPDNEFDWSDWKF